MRKKEGLLLLIKVCFPVERKLAVRVAWLCLVRLQQEQSPSPCLTPCRDYGAVLSHSLSVLTVHICSPVCPTHQAPGSTTGVLFTEKNSLIYSQANDESPNFSSFTAVMLLHHFVNKEVNKLKNALAQHMEGQAQKPCCKVEELNGSTIYQPPYTLWSYTTLTQEPGWMIQGLL